MSDRKRDALRDAADTLVLAAVHDDATRSASAIAGAVLLKVQTSDNDQWIEQLATDLEDAGPGSPIGSAATAPVHGARRASRPDRRARR